MAHSMIRTSTATSAKWIFLIAFLFACLLFWWLPSILFRIFGIEDPLNNWALWVSALGIGSFSVGYLLPPLRFRSEISPSITDACEGLAWKATVWLAVPALLVAARFFWYRAGVAYGQGEGLSFPDQAILYAHLFFAFLFLGAARSIPGNRRRIIVASIIVTLPRLIISLHWGRFFLGQAVVPILFIALARGWIRLTVMRWLQLAALVQIMVFVPALVRGEQFLQQGDLIKFFAAGSSLNLLQDNADMDLTNRCPPLPVSMTAKLIPYGLLGACTMDAGGRENMPASLDRILTYNDPTLDGTAEGTGGNYLLELYLSGGIFIVVIGSVLFGFSNRCFIDWIGRRSLFSGIWAECISRSLFAPRANLGYVYERIPSLVLVTIFLVVAAVAFRILELQTMIARENPEEGRSA
jgi:hypothetical protein